MADFDALYTAHAPILIARLTRRFGPERLAEVESAVQDAFLRAMRSWPTSGEPDEPRAWLHVVARNAMVDRLRATRRLDDDQALASAAAPETTAEATDDLLRMMFVTCSPALPLASRVVLTLRTLCPLETPAIAAALLTSPDAIEKRLVRARALLRERGVQMDPPDRGERLDSVLAVIYLLFNEGYASHDDQHPIRRDLVQQALSLASLFRDPPPRVHALLALMSLHASRLDARVRDGELQTLAEQDRSLWDRRLIAVGLRHLVTSASGEEVSAYHLEAGIAACHALAPTFAETDWARVTGYYDALEEIAPSPVVSFNRAIATSFLDPERGLKALREVARDPTLQSYGLTHAALGDVQSRLGDLRRAREAYSRALELVQTDAERRHLQRRLAELS